MIGLNIELNTDHIELVLSTLDRDMPKNTEKRLIRKVMQQQQKNTRPLLPKAKWRSNLRYDTWPDFRARFYIKKTKDTWQSVFYEVGRGPVLPKKGPYLKFYSQDQGHWVRPSSAASLPQRKPVWTGLDNQMDQQDLIMGQELQKIIDEVIQRNF